MAKFWIRAGTLQIGPKKYTLEGLTFAFTVVFDDSPQLCTSDIEVYNLSPTTRNNIKKGHVVILNAGYEGDIGVIFVGQVATCSHEIKGTDIVTKIKATSAMDEWLSKEINKTYKQGIKADAIITDLLNIFGMEVGTFELAVNKDYPRGRTCKGKLKDVLVELVTKDCKSRLLIRTGQIIISDPTKGIKMGCLLSPATGLLRSAGDADQQQIATNLDTQKGKEQKDEESATKTRECLLNYRLGPAEEVKFQSETLNGKFIVVRGRHIGSHDRDWKTEIEVKPAS